MSGTRLAATALRADAFRDALARYPAGVVVVTTSCQGRRAAVIIASFTSASLDPPLISYCLKKDSSSGSALIESEWFAVNFLSDSQSDVAAGCSRSDVDRFSVAGVWSTGSHGLPFLEGATVHLMCRRERVIEVGDHFLIVGAVADVRVTENRNPLLCCRRSYAGVEKTMSRNQRTI
ncbi:flavin reductase family protein [Streptomyces murinus]|uniref:flavin reductase family protein n=1 Tax=Streptomyces murinus TaxID=33900 RepID=UPI00380BA0F7